MTMVNRKRIRGGWEFRHFGKQYEEKSKVGLYLNCFFSIRERFFIPDKEVIEIRDWLSRYINEQILKTTPASIPEIRANARRIIKNAEKLEAEL